MSLSSSLMKEITHYFRPSIKNDEETDGCRGYSKSNSNVEADDELKSDDCELYLSGSDNDSDFVTPKKKHHLVVQVPGISVSKCSIRKRKRKEDLSPRVKKIRTLQSDSPVSRTRKFNGENEKAEDSCYMSPLRLDSDSSSEGSPVRKQTSSNSQSEASPVYRATGKRKGSLRLAKNPFLNSSKSTSDTTVDNPKKSKKSISPKSPVKKPSKEKELGGSLYKFFGNVMSPKAKIPEIKCISLPSDEQPEVVLLSPCDKPGKGDSTLTKKSVQPREKAANISVSADHNHVGISQQVESVTKSPAESSVSMGKTLRDREASSSIRQADGSKGSRLLPSPKIVSELRNSASNNILNYFDKASKPTKSKKKKFKKLKRRPEEKVMPEVAAAVEIDTVNLSTDSVLEITEPTEIENTKARRSSLRSLSLSSSESTKRSGVQEKSDNVRTKSIDPATCGTCDSSGKETIVTRRRSRTSVSNVVSNESVTPSVNQNKSPSILKNQAPPVSIKGGSSSHAQTKQGLSTSQEKGESYAKKNVGNQLSSRNQRPNKSTAGKSSINMKEVSTGKKPSNNRKSSGGAGKSVGQSSKKSPTSVKKVISPSRSNQKSANQCRAAKIVKRACQPTLQRQIIRRIRDPGIPGSKSLDEVIILSEQTENGTTKEIVIRPSYVKLAPLFVAKEEYQRKKFFLQSGVPDIVLRRMKEQKRMEVELEEASDFPSVSHTLQIDASFPWCLEENPTLSKNLSLSPVDPVGEQEKILSILSEKLCLGCISSLPSILAAMLVQLRPPLPNLDSPEGSPSRTLDSPGSPHCFCLEMSPDVSIDETSQEFSSHDVEMFERVHAWLMRSLLPPGVAFKMCVDLSFFLPSSSPAGFESDHIFALPHDSSGPVLRKQMLLKLKEEYPSYPVNRKYKDFYQRRKTDGGLYPFSHPPGYEVIILDSPPPDNDVSDKSSSKNSSSDPKTLFSTPSNSRRSSRRGSVMQSTPSVVEAKEVSGQNSDSIMNSLLSMNDTAVKASCSSLLTSESWTDVFAPVSFADACSLGRNLKTLDKLRNWLDSWAKKSTSSKKSKSSNGFSDSDEEYSSGIEFCSSDEEDGKRENRNLPTNVAILIGPCGSGKTSSVYALAKELNYKVLEINASAKRSGKYILATVKEATRSYQVMSSGGQNSPASIGSFFKKSTPKKSPASTRKRTPKKSPKPAEKASSAMSLIFVEDVDVVFENEDEGFIGALTSLTTSTKRPVILEVHMSKPLRMGTTNNWLLEEMLTESCPHLINFLAKQNRTPLILPFVRTRNTLHSEALLRVACLSEGVWVSKQWSECLFKHTAGDFRRAIQGAQFWAGSVARSSIMLDNLTRYPKQLTQKSDMSDEKSADLMAKKLAPVNLCGCLGRKACSYPYSWMHKDYIQHIWLKLDKIVDTAMLIMQGVASSGSASEKVFCLSPSVGRTLKSASKEGSAIKQEPSPISPKSEVSSEVPLIKKNLLSMFNDSMKSEKEDLGGTPSSVRLSPRINKGNRRIRLTPSRRKNVSLPNHHLDPVDVKHKVKVNEGEKTEEDTPKDVASEKLKSLVGGRRYSPKDCHKMDIMAFDDYLDVLCTSDVLLKKFQTAGDLELGKSMVFEMGNVSRLINISMRVSNSEKSREMEAKQAKDSCTAAQYQMILPIMPNHWLLNCPALALDVAPHIRETCRILDELTQTGKTRTRLSHRIPTINRLGPTLREALSRTLVDDINIHDLPSVDIELKKEEEKCVN